jgi:hypothetical protein
MEAPGGRIDLTFTATATGVRSAPSEGTLEGITGFYQGLQPGRVVITGAPPATATANGAAGAGGPRGDAGSGKTVLALVLLLGLARGRAVGKPVPVRLTAASWPGNEVRQWLGTHLTGAYGFRRRDAELVIDAELVLPVIDGLDEMDGTATPGYTSRAAALLRAIERFESGGEHCPVVLTSRHAHYQALADADAQPRVVALLALDRVNPARACAYLEQRVAASATGRARWQPVLDALDAATSSGGTVPSAAAELASALDTPWRLTLASTVFQERTPQGTYLRDPAGLIALAANGHLYEYLLDRYIGAAVAAPHYGPEKASSPAPGGKGRLPRRSRPPRLKVGLTERRLTVLAHYLKLNVAGRAVSGHTLSSTDLVLHELWPLAGPHRVKRVMGALNTVLALAWVTGMLCLLPARFHLWLSPLAALVLLGAPLLGSATWPQPLVVGLRSRYTRTRGQRLWYRTAFGLAFGAALALPFVLAVKFSLGFVSGLGIWFVLTAALTVPVYLAFVGTTEEEVPISDPRDLIRSDLTLRLGHGLSIGITLGLAFDLVGGLLVGLAPAFFSERAVSVRYFAFLLCTRGHLPWRLGYFLDACYQLGILRTAGTAWQFRHRELQDHLAIRPATTSFP